MQHLEVSGAVRHIYIYVIRQLKVNLCDNQYIPVTDQTGICSLYNKQKQYVLDSVRQRSQSI